MKKMIVTAAENIYLLCKLQGSATVLPRNLEREKTRISSQRKEECSIAGSRGETSG